MSQADVNRRNRQRGKAFERRVVQLFRKYGFNCRRMPYSGSSAEHGKGDVQFIDPVPFYVECKSWRVDVMDYLHNQPFQGLMRMTWDEAQLYDNRGHIAVFVVFRDTKSRIICFFRSFPRLETQIYRLEVDGWEIHSFELLLERLACAYSYLLKQRSDSASPEGEGNQ